MAAIEAGIIQRDIQDSAYRAQQAIDAGTDVVVGVNRFTENNGTTSGPEVFEIDPELERQQVARVSAVRMSRDHLAWRHAIDAVMAAARGTDNLMPRIIAAVEARATVGEISDAMRNVFGEFRDTSAA